MLNSVVCEDAQAVYVNARASIARCQASSARMSASACLPLNLRFCLLIKSADGVNRRSRLSFAECPAFDQLSNNLPIKGFGWHSSWLAWRERQPLRQKADVIECADVVSFGVPCQFGDSLTPCVGVLSSEGRVAAVL